MPKDKLGEFKQILEDQNLNGFIVSNPINIFYLTGFRGLSQTEREVYLVFSPNATLIAPRLYQNEALKLQSKNLKVKIDTERDGLLQRVGAAVKRPKSVRPKIGFEKNDLKYGEYQGLLSKKIKLVPYADLVESMRAVKTADEIARIEKAQIISQKAFGQIIKTLKIGQTEAQIADRLAQIIKSLGGQGLAFESIIASGPNSRIPHHLTSERRLALHDTLIMDFGAKFQDYRADLSRTIFIGKASDIQKNIYMHVQTAQKKALEKITHNMHPSDAFHAANDHFKMHKLEKYFLHGLGHGIGLEIHEEPYLRSNLPATKRKLQTNMVFSVEPGLYFPWGGVRIEDLVALVGSKTKVLGKLSKGIIEIRK